MRKLEAIIFDMDWVLINSSSIIWQCFETIFREEYWVDISSREPKKYLWRALKDQLAMLRAEYGVTEEIDVQEFSALAFSKELQSYNNALHPDNHILQLIQTAKEHNIKLAVATSSTRPRATTILHLLQILNKLDVFVTVENIIHGKPAPDIFLKTAEKLNIDPKNCIVIEDSVNGIQAAHAAGMKWVAKLTSHHTKQDFEHENAEYIFESFDEIQLKDLQNLYS